MTFSALAGDRRLALGMYLDPTSGRRLRRYMARQSKVVNRVVNHHIVGDIGALQGALLNESRTLSVNYGISSNGVVYGCVSEDYKANTTSHAVDHQAVTIEIGDQIPFTSDWKMTDSTWHAAARLNADIAKRHGFEPNADTIRFHRQYVQTQCPGEYMWSRRAEFIDLVRSYYFGKDAPATEQPEATVPEEDDMKIISSKAGGQRFVDEFGSDDIGEFFFTPNGPDKTPSWSDNIYASWLVAGKPEEAPEGWQFDLARHIANARWDRKRGQIVTDTVKALSPLLEQIGAAVAGLSKDAIQKAIADGLKDVVVEAEPLSDEDAAKIAALTRDEFRKDPLS